MTRSVWRGTVPIPDFQKLVTDEGLDPSVLVLGAAAVVFAVLVVMGLIWIRRDSAPNGTGVVLLSLFVAMNLCVHGAIYRYGKYEARLETAGAEQISALFKAQEQIGAELEAYYGIDFYRMPGIPEEGDAPQRALVRHEDRVERCWVHTVEAEGRLAVSCGTDDAATATELPAAG